MRDWIINHDESWLFTIAYIGLAVGLSIWLGIFWLIVVVAVHGVLEYVRQTQLGNGLAAVAWELKLDVSLVLLALVVAAYMELILGAAGLGGAARLGAQATNAAVRATGWSSAIRGILLSADDAVQVARFALVRSSPEGAAAEGEVRGSRWGIGDHIAIWLGAAAVLLLILAPPLTGQTPGEVGATLLAELHPWPR